VSEREKRTIKLKKNPKTHKKYSIENNDHNSRKTERMIFGKRNKTNISILQIEEKVQ
jgi:hypothetical protein